MNNLKLPLVAPNQAQKEITINDQALALDAAFSEILDVDFAEGPQELDEEQFTRNFTFNCINLSADATLTVQPVKRLFAVQNSSAHEVTVDVFNAVGDTVIIEPGEMSILHCDGTNVRTAVAGGQVEGVADIDEQGFYVRIEGEWVEVEAGDNINLNLEDGKLVISATGGGGGGGIDDVLGDDPHVRVNGEWLKLKAGSNVTFDRSVEGELTVRAVGGDGSTQGGEFMPIQIVQHTAKMFYGGYSDNTLELDDPPSIGNMLMWVSFDYHSTTATKHGWTRLNDSTDIDSYYAKVFYKRVREGDAASSTIESPYSASGTRGSSSLLLELEGIIAPTRGDVYISEHFHGVMEVAEFRETPTLPNTLCIGLLHRLGGAVNNDDPMVILDNSADLLANLYSEQYSSTTGPGKSLWFSKLLPNPRESELVLVDIPDGDDKTRAFTVHILPNYVLV